MSKHCFFFEAPNWYCKNDVHERNPWWQFYNKTYGSTKHRYHLKLTLNTSGATWSPTINALVFSSNNINYANGRLMDVFCPITGDTLETGNQGIVTTSYWFMPQKAQNFFNNTIFGTKDPLQNISNSISHIVTNSGFIIDYKNTPATIRYTTSYTFDQNKWYHICVKYDNTPSSSPNTGTATTQLWINGVSQTLQAQGGGSTALWQTNVYGGGSIIRYTVTVMDDAYFGNFPSSAGFQTGYQGTSDYAIGNFKHFIATDGTNYSAKRAVPDYNTAADLFNEGAPDQSIITSGFIKSQGLSAIGNNKLVLSTSDTERLTILSGGNVGIGNSNPGSKLHVNGNITKSSGSFTIDHPLPNMSNTHNLYHSFIEGPKADLIYRGKVDLINGSASINLDTVSNMTSGTFEVLNRDVQCFTSNESDWDAVKGSVSGNALTISCQNASSTANVSWLVIGERKDKHMYDTNWTDDDGHVIPEQAKST
jgi:hypothetical protein